MQSWMSLVRLYLARNRRSDLIEAITASEAAQEPNLANMLRAFDAGERDRVDGLSRDLFDRLHSHARSTEANLINTMRLKMGLQRLHRSATQHPTSAQNVPAVLISSPSQHDLADTLHTQGLSHLQLEDYAAAKNALTEAAKLFHLLTPVPKDELANVLSNLGLSHYQLQDYVAARDASGEAAELYRSFTPVPAFELASVLTNLGVSYRDLQDYVAARDASGEAAELYRSFTPVPAFELANVLSNLGVSHYQLQDYVAARDAFTEAAELYRSFTPVPAFELAIVLTNLGSSHYQLQDYVAARDASGEAAELHRSFTPVPAFELANVLTNLGLSHQELQDYVAARDASGEAAELYRSFTPVPAFELANVLTNLGRSHYQLQDYVAARDALTEAAELFHLLAPVPKDELASVLTSLGLSHLQLEDYAAARDALNEATELLEKMEKWFGSANCYLLLGYVEEGERRWDVEATRVQFEKCVERCELGLLQLQEQFRWSNFKGQIEYAYRWLIEFYARRIQAGREHTPENEDRLINLMEAVRQVGMLARLRHPHDATVIGGDGTIAEALGSRDDRQRLLRDDGAFLWVQETPTALVFAWQTSRQLRVSVTDRGLYTEMEALYNALRTAIETMDAGNRLLWLKQEVDKALENLTIALPEGNTFPQSLRQTVGVLLETIEEQMFTKQPEVAASLADVQLRLLLRLNQDTGMETTAEPTGRTNETEEDMLGLLPLSKAINAALEALQITSPPPRINLEERERFIVPIALAGERVFDALPPDVQALLTQDDDHLLFLSCCANTVNFPWEIVRVRQKGGNLTYLGLHRELPRSPGWLQFIATRDRQPKMTNGGRNVLLVGDPKDNLKYARDTAEDISALLRENNYTLCPEGTALLGKDATAQNVQAAMQQPFVLWLHLAHGGYTDRFFIELRDSDLYPDKIAECDWAQAPVLHFPCCFAAHVLGLGGGKFDSHPMAALMAGASCFLASSHEVFDEDDVLFCEQLYTQFIGEKMSLGEALLATRRSIAQTDSTRTQEPNDPLVWGSYVLWGNPRARLNA